MDDCIVFEGIACAAPDPLHERMMERIVDMDIRIKELEGHLNEAMNFAMEQQGSIVMLEAENARLRAALPVPTGLREVADVCLYLMDEDNAADWINPLPQEFRDLFKGVEACGIGD